MMSEVSPEDSTAPNPQRTGPPVASDSIVPLLTSTESESAAVQVQAIRFCRICGTAWDPTSLTCARCAARASKTAAVELTYARERRSIFSALWLYFALLSVSIVTIALLTIAGQAQTTVVEEFVETGVMSALTLGWCFAFGRELLKVLRRVPGLKWFAMAIGLALVTVAVALTLVGAMEHWAALKKLNYLENFQTEGYGFGWAVVAICVLPAVFEELAFRGVILGSLARAIPAREAMLASALMFAILHLSIPSIPHLFLLGFLLAWLRMKTRSLYPGMLLHFTHNLIVLVIERHGSIPPW